MPISSPASPVAESPTPHEHNVVAAEAAVDPPETGVAPSAVHEPAGPFPARTWCVPTDPPPV